MADVRTEGERIYLTIGGVEHALSIDEAAAIECRLSTAAHAAVYARNRRLQAEREAAEEARLRAAGAVEYEADGKRSIGLLTSTPSRTAGGCWPGGASAPSSCSTPPAGR